jgi:signal peptidase I
MPPAHSHEGDNCHPGLTFSERAERSGAMVSAKTRRASQKSARSSRDKESAGGLLRFIVTLVVLAWALRAFIAAPFNIPSGSMEPTLYIGDYLVVAKWPYGYSRASFPFGIPAIKGRIAGHLPHRGDVVVFRHPVENADLIKRVIGLPGDTVEVRDGQLVLNGKPVPRRKLAPYRLAISANSPCTAVPPSTPVATTVNGTDYCLYPAYEETLPGGPSYTVLDQVDGGPGDDFAPVRVPAGRIFLMGDNRDNSADSRFMAGAGGIGMVPTDNLIGRAMVTFWSTDGTASWWKPWTWFGALRLSRVGNGYSGTAE